MALTDEVHLPVVGDRYPGANAKRATVGPACAERTATEIWSILLRLETPPLLWNVFPFHPHEAGDQFTNRKFTAHELRVAEALNRELIRWLGISRIVAIGQDAAAYAASLGVEVVCVRHPSYGGVRDFRDGISKIYSLSSGGRAEAFQPAFSFG